MHDDNPPALPRFVIFEGVDGTGKTTLARALARYYERLAPDGLLYYDCFPGSLPGTLGEWVYRLHHGRVSDAPPPETIAPPALQLLHVAAHVDTILNRIAPTFARGGVVILDRYWWSTYAYSRRYLSKSRVRDMVKAERIFWRDLPQPLAIYLTRAASLKPDEVAPLAHRELDTYYQEVIDSERAAGLEIRELVNDGTLDDAWSRLLHMLELPYQAMPPGA